MASVELRMGAAEERRGRKISSLNAISDFQWSVRLVSLCQSLLLT